MFRKKRKLSVGLTAAVLFSITFPTTAKAAGTDIVASDDVVNGASVFVFRSSRKRPQESGGSAAGVGAGTRAYRQKVSAQLTATRKKKTAAAQARRTQLAKARAKALAAKIKLSNTLTARGEDQLEMGEIAAATASFREALKANPKNVDAAKGLSEALTATGIETANLSQDAALPYFNEAVKYDARNEVAFAKLGEINDAAGKNQLAITNYEKALTIDPELSTLYLPLGMAYAEAGNNLKAEAYFAKADAAGMGGSDVKLARGALLAKQGKNAEALQMFDAVTAAEPQNADAQYRRGGVLAKMQQTDKAVDAYRKAVNIDPNHSAAWFELGVIYYNGGDYKNALNAYNRSIAADPNNARAHANLASTYRQLERYPEANAEYAIAAQTIKTDPDLYSEWGFCLGKTKDWDNSTRQLETANAISPSAVDETNVGWAYYNKAQDEKKNKRDAEAGADLAKAKTSLEKAVQKDPNLDAAYLNLGSTHNSMGEHDKAILALNNAVRLHNDWTIALNQLGLAYQGSNNLAMAMTQFNRVVLLDGNNIAGLFNLGSAQYASGDKKGAKKTQDKLKKLDPSLGERLGNVIAGRLIEEGTRRVIDKIRIPGFPY